MSDLLAGPLILDIVIAVLALETVLLIVFNRQTGRGLLPAELLPSALSGIFLLLTFRIWLADGPALLVVLCLLASFSAHLFDLRRRWRA